MNAGLCHLILVLNVIDITQSGDCDKIDFKKKRVNIQLAHILENLLSPTNSNSGVNLQ